MTGSTSAVLGFRPHTGWAAVVALLPARDAPIILDRRRIAYAPQTGRFLYHQAAELPLAVANALILSARSQTLTAATDQLEQLLETLRIRQVVAAAVIPTGNTKLPTKLEDILGTHSRIHAAEGVFYRETLADACAQLGIPVHQPPARDLWSMAEKRTGLNPDALVVLMRKMGASLGPPWGEDQKIATLAAWACPAPQSDRPRPSARIARRRIPER